MPCLILDGTVVRVRPDRKAAMLFWALLASGLVTMRKMNDWQTLAMPLAPANFLDLAA